MSRWFWLHGLFAYASILALVSPHLAVRIAAAVSAVVNCLGFLEEA